MSTVCGAKCEECGLKDNCQGCEKTNGKPFGGDCLTAQCFHKGGCEYFAEYKNKLIEEFNALGVQNMPKIDSLFSLAGFYVNLAYPLPSGEKGKLLDDKKIYLGNQVPAGQDGRCYGLVGGADFLLVAEYGENGSDPELVIYKKRDLSE